MILNGPNSISGGGSAPEPIPMVPPSLADDLRALHAGAGPSELLSRAILVQAQREFDALELRRRNVFRLQRLGALAAMVVLFVLVARLVSNRTGGLPGSGGAPPGAPKSGAPVAYAAEFDVNGDRVVDIVDALRLRALLNAGSPGAATSPWDVTGDGRTDGGDVDAIAMRAVRLGGAS
ncbi:MAG: dockerin type I domain-containing protein [Phycisphaerales bacterium]